RDFHVTGVQTCALPILKSGYNLREIIDMVDKLPFGTSKDKHELSHLYETKIKNMGNAGRNGGQYYTPRPLIRAMISVIDPKIGEIGRASCRERVASSVG